MQVDFFNFLETNTEKLIVPDNFIGYSGLITIWKWLLSLNGKDSLIYIFPHISCNIKTLTRHKKMALIVVKIQLNTTATIYCILINMDIFRPMSNRIASGPSKGVLDVQGYEACFVSIDSPSRIMESSTMVNVIHFNCLRF